MFAASKYLLEVRKREPGKEAEERGGVLQDLRYTYWETRDAAVKALVGRAMCDIARFDNLAAAARKKLASFMRREKA